ncbi:sensor histidine kinase [Nonomuraea sp. NPDC049269]|uniref:sensor histidine kinase n=1 Tax=Nonomuraea sp. NPDC049269 TaxID=3364349 RepID=UPI0037195A59
MSRRRLSVRWRLTVVYGTLFFLAAIILVGVNYFVVTRIVSQSIDPGSGLPEPPDRVFVQQVMVEVDGYKNRVIDSIVSWSILATVLVGLGGLAVGWSVARRALGPLQQVTDTFDSMLERLDRAFDGQRRFVANASHELKTPLAIDRALLQVSFADATLPAELRPVRDHLLASNSRQERLIEGLLTLAQTESELTDREPVDLAELARSALDRYPGVDADLAAAPATGDALLLERVVVNLADNAVKYNDSRGSVFVRTGSGADGSFVVVENTGPEIAPAQVPHLFEPFRRLNDDRTGSASGAGLGLSIVRAVARVHSGTAAAVPREGGELVVTVRIPSRS